MKLFKGFITVTLFLFFTLNTAYSFLEYTPDEETENFRKTVKSSHIFNGYTTPEYGLKRTPEIKEFEKFPGFEVLYNHLPCRGCESEASRRSIREGSTLDHRFRFIKDQASPNSCWHGIGNCKDYALSTIILEKCPNKDEAILILNYCIKKTLWCPFGTAEIFKFIDYPQVETPEEATLVIYSKGPQKGTHYGIYRGNGVVESKWGSMRTIFRHKVFQVPLEYGDNVSFHKIVFKKLPPNLAEEYWPNSSWKFNSLESRS